MNYYDGYYQEIDDNEIFENFEKFGNKRKFKEHDPEKIRRMRKLQKRKRGKDDYELE